jgi:hypothetical protein
MIFQRFAELGAEPCLVRSTELDYADLDYAADVEVLHPGSTRRRSFLRTVRRAGFVRDARPPAVHGGVTTRTYLRKELPAMEFTYTRPRISDAVREVDPASVDNLPAGIDGTAHYWADLEGEGTSGVLKEQAGATYHNPGGGTSRAGRMPSTLSTASLAGGQAQLLDLVGDGRPDLVSFGGPAPGELTSVAHVPWEDTNVRHRPRRRRTRRRPRQRLQIVLVLPLARRGGLRGRGAGTQAT